MTVLMGDNATGYYIFLTKCFSPDVQLVLSFIEFHPITLAFNHVYQLNSLSSLIFVSL